MLWKLFIVFVLHEEFFCLKDVVFQVALVDLKVLILCAAAILATCQTFYKMIVFALVFKDS